MNGLALGAVFSPSVLPMFAGDQICAILISAVTMFMLQCRPSTPACTANRISYTCCRSWSWQLSEASVVISAPSLNKVTLKFTKPLATSFDNCILQWRVVFSQFRKWISTYSSNHRISWCKIIILFRLFISFAYHDLVGCLLVWFLWTKCYSTIVIVCEHLYIMDKIRYFWMFDFWKICKM